MNNLGKLSLANKYRPKTFEEIVEQDEIKSVLRHQIETNTLKHVYLFSGGAGTGKTTSARLIARAMNKTEMGIYELDCASHNSVNDAENIISDCRSKPLNGAYKIYILDECHMLTPQAWNAMLKLIEEPPEYVIMLLCTTDPQKIIPTIMSRVQKYSFNRISTTGIKNRLQFILEQEDITTYEEESLNYIARIANGGMREAISTLEKCLDYDKNLTIENVKKVTSNGAGEDDFLLILADILNQDAKMGLEHYNEIYMKGIDNKLFLELLKAFLENSIKYLITKNKDIVTLTDYSIEWLDKNEKFINEIRDLLFSLIDIRSRFYSDDLKIIIESWIIERCL